MPESSKSKVAISKEKLKKAINKREFLQKELNRLQKDKKRYNAQIRALIDFLMTVHRQASNDIKLIESSKINDPDVPRLKRKFNPVLEDDFELSSGSDDEDEWLKLSYNSHEEGVLGDIL